MKLYAIYGNPVSHSKSPLLHNSAFLRMDIRQSCYTRIELHDKNILLDNFRTLSLSGANITVPFKEDAYMQCDEVRGLAKEIRAVNTLVYEDGRIIGYNTDCDGFIKSIEEFMDVKSVLILGAGGTAKAISVALKNIGVDCTVLNRSSARLSFFEDSGITAFDWNSFEKGSYDLVVNTTSAGLSDDLLPLPEEMLAQILEHSKYAYDVIYNKTTPFLSKAADAGLICKDGKQMLVYQAVYAFMKFSGNGDFEKIAKIMNGAIEL